MPDKQFYVVFKLRVNHILIHMFQSNLTIWICSSFDVCSIETIYLSRRFSNYSIRISQWWLLWLSRWNIAHEFCLLEQTKISYCFLKMVVTSQAHQLVRMDDFSVRIKVMLEHWYLHILLEMVYVVCFENRNTLKIDFYL